MIDNIINKHCINILGNLNTIKILFLLFKWNKLKVLKICSTKNVEIFLKQNNYYIYDIYECNLYDNNIEKLICSHLSKKFYDYKLGDNFLLFDRTIINYIDEYIKPELERNNINKIDIDSCRSCLELDCSENQILNELNDEKNNQKNKIDDENFIIIDSTINEYLLYFTFNKKKSFFKIGTSNGGKNKDFSILKYSDNELLAPYKSFIINDIEIKNSIINYLVKKGFDNTTGKDKTYFKFKNSFFDELEIISNELTKNNYLEFKNKIKITSYYKSH